MTNFWNNGRIPKPLLMMGGHRWSTTSEVAALTSTCMNKECIKTSSKQQFSFFYS